MALTQISTDGIKNGTITNADIGASAAIDGSKINGATFNQSIVTSSTQIRVNKTGSTTVDGFMGEAYSNYFGLKHTDQTFNSEYMILSNNSHTYISATSGNNVYIRPGGNLSTNQMIVSTSGTTIGGNLVLTTANEGTGNGLDADTVDGIEASSFLRSDANDTSSGTVAFGASALDPDSFAGHSGGFGGIADGSGWSARGLFVHGGGTGDAAAMAHNGGALYFGIQDGANANSMETWLQVTPGSRVISFQTDDNANNVRVGVNKIFHAGNDGSGSGLDADLLDGVQGSSFLRSDATDTCSGQITFTNQIISAQDGDKSTQGGAALVLRHATNSAMRANHFIHDDFPSGSATYYIQATEAGVSNDRNMCLQGYGGNVKIGGAGNAPTEKLDVAGNITVSGTVIANKLSFDASDTDTFIDRPNSNQIEITVANKEVATFIDGSNNRPAMLIDKDQTNNGAGGVNFNSNGNANDLVVGNVSSNNHGITICTPSTGVGTLNFSDGSGGGQDAYRGSVSYDHANEVTVLRAKTGNVALRRDATDTLLATSSGVTVQGGIQASGHAAITGTAHTYLYGKGSQGGGLSVYAAEAALEVVSSEDGTHGGSLLLRTTTDGAGFVYNPTTNALELRLFTTSADSFAIHGTGTNLSSLDTQLRVVKDGTVELYHNGSKKLETISGGITVTGGINTTAASTFNQSTFNSGAGAVSIASGSDIRFATGGWTGEHAGKITHHANYLYFQGGSSGFQFRSSSGTDRLVIDSSGHVRPAANNTYDLGTSSYRWRNVYTNDLNLSNEGGSNDVDGTWGSYTIQEGAEDLFLVNKRNGKKYKFNLTEVS